MRSILSAVVVVLLVACSSPERRPTEEERLKDIARLQRIVVAMGACASVLAADRAAASQTTQDDRTVADVIVFASCLIAGGVGVLGLPEFADPQVPPPDLSPL